MGFGSSGDLHGVKRAQDGSLSNLRRDASTAQLLKRVGVTAQGLRNETDVIGDLVACTCCGSLSLTTRALISSLFCVLWFSQMMPLPEHGSSGCVWAGVVCFLALCSLGSSRHLPFADGDVCWCREIRLSRQSISLLPPRSSVSLRPTTSTYPVLASRVCGAQTCCWMILSALSLPRANDRLHRASYSLQVWF